MSLIMDKSIPNYKVARRRSQVRNPIDLLQHSPDCTGGIGGNRWRDGPHPRDDCGRSVSAGRGQLVHVLG